MNRFLLKICWPWYLFIPMFLLLLTALEILGFYVTSGNLQGTFISIVASGITLMPLYWHNFIRYHAYKVIAKKQFFEGIRFREHHKNAAHESLEYMNKIFYANKINPIIKLITFTKKLEYIYFRIFSYAVYVEEGSSEGLIIIKDLKLNIFDSDCIARIDPKSMIKISS